MKTLRYKKSEHVNKRLLRCLFKLHRVAQTQGQSGLTLIELLAAITISAVIAGAILSVLWPTMVRSLHMMTYNTAQREVVFVNQAITTELRKANYVQVQSGTTTTGQRRIILWLYQGSPQNAFVNNTINPAASLPWLYNTTTALPSPATNNTTSLAIVSPQGAFGALLFTQDTSQSWTVAYTTDMAGVQPSAGVSACTTQDLQTIGGSSLQFTRSGFNVQFDFPNLTSMPDCVFVNSFVIRLTTHFQSSTGQAESYTLTAGYHDKDRR